MSCHLQLHLHRVALVLLTPLLLTGCATLNDGHYHAYSPWYYDYGYADYWYFDDDHQHAAERHDRFRARHDRHPGGPQPGDGRLPRPHGPPREQHPDKTRHDDPAAGNIEFDRHRHHDAAQHAPGVHPSQPDAADEPRTHPVREHAPDAAQPGRDQDEPPGQPGLWHRYRFR